MSGNELTLSSVVPKLANSTTATALVTTYDCVNQTLANGESCTDSVLLTGISEGTNTLNFWAYTFNGTVGSKASVDMNFNIGNKFIYIANSTDASISRCPVNSTTGVMTACTVIRDETFIAPFGITFNAAGTLAYVTNYPTQSGVNMKTGVFSACTPFTDNSFQWPASIVFNSAGTMAFIPSVLGDTISRCSVNPTTGALSACTAYTSTDLDYALSYPFNIAFNAAHTKAFITNLDHHVAICSFNSDTDVISACTTHSDDSFNTPSAMTLNASTTRACPVDPSSGEFSDCTDFTDPSIDSPFGLTFNSAGTVAFVTSLYNDSDTTQATGTTISTCPFNTTTGKFSACNAFSDPTFSNPAGIALL